MESAPLDMIFRSCTSGNPVLDMAKKPVVLILQAFFLSDRYIRALQDSHEYLHRRLNLIVRKIELFGVNGGIFLPIHRGETARPDICFR